MSDPPNEILDYIKQFLEEDKVKQANMTKEEKRQRSVRFWAMHDQRMEKLREQEEKMRVTPDMLNRYYDI